MPVFYSFFLVPTFQDSSFSCFSSGTIRTMYFPSLGNSDHVVVSVSIDFPLNSQWDALFWDSLCDYLRHVPWEDILNSVLLLLLVNFKNFSKNSNVDDLGISLPALPSRTNLKLHNFSVTPKIAKKSVTNLHSSKASGPDFIPVVVLKNCEPELLYILAELFNKSLKVSCFPDCWKVSSVVPVF